MPKTQYCLYSPTRGYLVKKFIFRDEYASYWFANKKEYSSDLVIIFDSIEEAQTTRRFWAKHGPLHKEDTSPVPDVRVRIAGTSIDLPLSEDE